MAKSKETGNKKEKEKRRLRHKQDKREKMEARRQNAKKGKPLEEMMAYIDENGNLSDVPPDPRKIREFKAEDISLKIEPKDNSEAAMRTGTVNFFDTQKGFGFILDSITKEKIFVHVNDLAEPVSINDIVTYIVMRGNRGPVATEVRKIS